MNILIIEDSPEQAVVVKSFLTLTHPEAKLEIRESLEDALQVLGEKDFHTILLDLGLPDASGIDVVISIHQKSPSTPIVVLTAAGDEGLGALCIQAGAHDYVTKTNITPDILARAVNFCQARQFESLQLDLTRHLASLKTVSGNTSTRSFKAFGKTYGQLLTEPRFLMSKSHKKLARVMSEKNVKASEVIALHAHCLEKASQDAEALELSRLLINSPTVILATIRFLSDSYAAKE